MAAAGEREEAVGHIIIFFPEDDLTALVQTPAPRTCLGQQWSTRTMFARVLHLLKALHRGTRANQDSFCLCEIDFSLTHRDLHKNPGE